MSQLTDAVNSLVARVGEEQAALLIAGLALSMNPGGREFDQVIKWFGESPKLTSENLKAIRAYAEISFGDRLEMLLLREKASRGRLDRISVYAELYEFATDKAGVLETAKKDLSVASYQRLRERVGLAKSRT